MSEFLDEETIDRLTSEGLLSPDVAQQAKLRAMDARMGQRSGQGFANLFVGDSKGMSSSRMEQPKPTRQQRQQRRQRRRNKMRQKVASELAAKLYENFIKGGTVQGYQRDAEGRRVTDPRQLHQSGMPIALENLPPKAIEALGLAGSGGGWSGDLWDNLNEKEAALLYELLELGRR